MRISAEKTTLLTETPRHNLWTSFPVQLILKKTYISFLQILFSPFWNPARETANKILEQTRRYTEASLKEF